MRPARGATGQRGPLVDGTHDFNPRAPCGARRGVLVKKVDAVTFQSTRPMRGATVTIVGPSFLIAISIHAPRAGRD